MFIVLFKIVQAYYLICWPGQINIKITVVVQEHLEIDIDVIALLVALTATVLRKVMVFSIAISGMIVVILRPVR